MYEKITYYSRMSQTLHVPVPASGLDSATQDWINAVRGEGGDVSPTQQGYVDTLIKGLKADNLFTIGDGLWLFAGENDAAQAKVSILAGNVLGTKGSTVTQAAGGYTGSGSDANSYFDTTIVPTVGVTKFQQDSASGGAYIRTQLYDGLCAWGIVSGSNSYAQLFQVETVFRYYINNFNQNNATILATEKIGFWCTSRTDANTTAAYRNGGNVFSNGSDASVAIPNVSMAFMARNNGGGSFTVNDGDTYGAAWMGGALDATQASNLYTLIQAYMTSWGFQV